MNRRTKIIATIGPATENPLMLEKMILAGTNVARLNFSHGTHKNHANVIQTIREIAAQHQKPLAIMLDLQGPKMRIGKLPLEGIILKIDQTIKFQFVDTEDPHSNLDRDVIPLNIPNVFDQITPKNRILLDDGNLELEVISVRQGEILTKVRVGGILKSHKGVHFPQLGLSLPALTDKDIKDLEFALQIGVDLVAVSYIQLADDIDQVRKRITKILPDEKNLPIIAKIERPEAIKNLHSILDVADGVMVARGDLAIETSPASVPIYQKKIIQEANQRKKIVITATQMLESMISSPRPTRAEASDVANAIFDGTDAVMLSGETAVGRYPIECIQMMDKIICESETQTDLWGRCDSDDRTVTKDDTTSITRAARELSNDRDVSGIAVFTITGNTALLMSKTRPDKPIIAITPDEKTYQKCSILWGVEPALSPFVTNVESMINEVNRILVFHKIFKADSQVIVISGFPIGAKRPPNMILLHSLGDLYGNENPAD